MKHFKHLCMLFAAMLLSINVWGADYDATAQGYANQAAVTTATVDGITITFDKGSNSNAPKYYTSGTAIRCYGGNTITVDAGETNITAISFTFGSSDGSNAISSNVGTYDNGTWSGKATSIVFTIGGTSGNRRISGISITTESGSENPTV